MIVCLRDVNLQTGAIEPAPLFPHANLMSTVAERICDGEILRLIQMWLKAPIMEMDQDGTKRNIGGGKGNRNGTPQGGVVSPLLSNLYLHLLDRIWERNNLPQRLFHNLDGGNV